MRPAAVVASVLVAVGAWCRTGAAQNDAPDAAEPVGMVVELRGDAGGNGRPVGAVSLAGVELNAAAGSGTRLVTWDRVRLVTGGDGETAARYQEIATAAWRARSRLQRGDAAGAEPLFESLAAQYNGVTGPTAALIREGLLRCRLRSAATASAVPVWLSWLESEPWRPSRGLASSFDGLGPVADRSTGLVPTLPPVFAGAGTVGIAEALRRGRDATDAGDARADALRELYALAAEHAAGSIDAVMAADRLAGLSAREGDDPAVRWCREIVTARCGHPEARLAARRALATRLTRASTYREPGWVEAWCRLGLGQSLVLEADPERVRLGILEFLHVAVRLDEDVPLLSGMALGLAAEASYAIGDEAAGRALLIDLLDRYPGHPVLGWPPLGELLDSPPSDGRGDDEETA